MRSRNTSSAIGGETLSYSWQYPQLRLQRRVMMRFAISGRSGSVAAIATFSATRTSARRETEDDGNSDASAASMPTAIATAVPGPNRADCHRARVRSSAIRAGEAVRCESLTAARRECAKCAAYFPWLLTHSAARSISPLAWPMNAFAFWP